jgi:hypothetical protein
MSPIESSPPPPPPPPPPWQEGLADEAELQSWFIQRISKFLASKGRRIIGEGAAGGGGIAGGLQVTRTPSVAAAADMTGPLLHLQHLPSLFCCNNCMWCDIPSLPSCVSACHNCGCCWCRTFCGC